MSCVRKKTSAVRNRIREWASMAGRDADLPVTDSFLLEMADDGVLRLKGCRAIVVCAPEAVAVTTDRFLLTVKGEGLYFRHYSDSDAAVGGRIDAVCFGR